MTENGASPVVALDRGTLWAPAGAICQLLELEPRLVRRLDIRPDGILAEVFLLNDDGDKYLDETGEPAVATMYFPLEVRP